MGLWDENGTVECASASGSFLSGPNEHQRQGQCVLLDDRGYFNNTTICR